MSEKLSVDKSFIIIEKNLKKYGDDLNLWYYSFQGQAFELYMDTRKGFLVLRPGSPKPWLVRKKHGKEIIGKELL